MTPIIDKKLYSTIDILISISSQPSIKPVSSKIISDETGLGLRYIEQILQSLVKSGIIKGVRGINGGYIIARERRKINLCDIYNAIETLKNSNKEICFSADCEDILVDLNDKINNVIKEHLKEITLEEIYNQVTTNKSKKKTKNKSDFVI